MSTSLWELLNLKFGFLVVHTWTQGLTYARQTLYFQLTNGNHIQNCLIFPEQTRTSTKMHDKHAHSSEHVLLSVWIWYATQLPFPLPTLPRTGFLWVLEGGALSRGTMMHSEVLLINNQYPCHSRVYTFLSTFAVWQRVKHFFPVSLSTSVSALEFSKIIYIVA